MFFENDKLEFKQLKSVIQIEIINSLKLSNKNKVDLVNQLYFYIAPHDQVNINDTQDIRLKRIEYLVDQFNIDINEKVHNFFTSFLCYAIYFRQQLIANYFISKGADINFIDCLGLSPINYLSNIIIIGKNTEYENVLNTLRNRIEDKVMFSTLEKMINHETQKLEYFHKNNVTNYCLYDAHTTSQNENITNGNDYYELYEILAYKFQEIIMDEELSKHYAVEIEEFRNKFSADTNQPSFFNSFKKTNKKNIIEFILAGDEPGALLYLKQNPNCVNICDIDLQSPLQWAIYMSQENKPNKFFVLIDELIQYGADPDHKNITGYNCIELAAWYDYCIDQQKGVDKYTLLNIIFNSLEKKDTIKFKKYTSDIEKYKKVMEYNHSIEKRKTFLQELKQSKNTNITLKQNNKFLKEEKKKIANELKLMALEDIRQFELSERIADELLLDENFIENKKVPINIPKSKKEKQKQKNNKQALKEARLKEEKNRLKDEETAKLKAKLEAEKQQKRLEAEEQQKRLEAEEQQKLLEAEEQQKRLEAEEQQKRLEAEEQQKRLEAEEQEHFKNKRKQKLRNKKKKTKNHNYDNYDNYSCNSKINLSESFVYEEQNIVPNYVPFYSEYQLNMIENNPHGQWIYITNPWLLHNKWINSYQQAQPLFYY